MAGSDVYRFEWRTEQAGVVMSNSLHYRQLSDSQPPFTVGAEELLVAGKSTAAGVAAWARSLMGEDASISCFIVEKVQDNSATGLERAVGFDNSIVGVGSDTLPPQCTAPFQISSLGTGPPSTWDWHMLYLGGLNEAFVNGPYFTIAFSAAHYTALPFLNFPRDMPADTPNFQLQVNEAKPQATAPADWRPMHMVSPPLWPSIKQSRKAFLCA